MLKVSAHSHPCKHKPGTLLFENILKKKTKKNLTILWFNIEAHPKTRKKKQNTKRPAAASKQKPPWLNDQPSSGSLLLNQFTPGAEYAAQRQSSHGHRFFSACKQSLERQKCSILDISWGGTWTGKRQQTGGKKSAFGGIKKSHMPPPMKSHCAAAAPRCH